MLNWCNIRLHTTRAFTAYHACLHCIPCVPSLHNMRAFIAYHACLHRYWILQVIKSLVPEKPGSRPASRPSSRPASRSAAKATNAPDSELKSSAHTNSGLTNSTIDLTSPSGNSLPARRKTGSKTVSRSIRSPQECTRRAAFGSSVGLGVKSSSSAAVVRKHGPAPNSRKAGSATGSSDRNAAATPDKAATRMTPNRAGSGVVSSLKATSSKEMSAAMSRNTGSAGRAKSPLSPQKTFRFEDVQEQDAELQAAAGVEEPVLSAASLTHKIVQQLDFTGSHHNDRHLFLEVGPSENHRTLYQ